MPTQLIKLESGNLIEVDVPADDAKAKNISGGVLGGFKIVEKDFSQIKPLVVDACRPIVKAWEEVRHELGKEMYIDQAEVEIGLSFEAGGDVYIAKSTVGANLAVKLTLKPVQSDAQ